MNLEVEVVKTDLSGEANSLCCRIDALGSGEIASDSSDLMKDGRPHLPVFTFDFKNASTHVALLFSALGNGNQEVGSCLYPMTFNNKMARILGPLIPTKVAQKTHHVYLSIKSLGMGVDKVIGKVWFHIRDLTSPKQRKSGEMNGTWKNLAKSESVPAKPDIAELMSREADIVCAASVPSETATLSVVFHSVTTSRQALTSNDILTIACIEPESTEIKEDALFNEEEGSFRTMPSLRAIKLKCHGRNDTLQLHVADKREKNPFFSASCPLSDLTPFHQYNWEYNWRWVPGVGGFNPEHSRGNLEANVTISLAYWPSRSDFQGHEGLEVLVNGVKFNCQHEETDLVLTCELTGMSTEDTKSILSRSIRTPPYGKNHENYEMGDNNNNMKLAVIQYFSTLKESSGYSFFSFDQNFNSRSGHQIVLSLFATSHNTDIWWHTDSASAATINLSYPLLRALLRPEYQNGVRWELSGNAITDASEKMLAVKKISGVLRWKRSSSEFLSQSITSRMPELPLLSEVVVTELDLDAVFSGSQVASDKQTSDPCVLWREAMATMGKDIIRLREENEQLKIENRDYEKYVLDMEASVIVTAADQKMLLCLTKNDLIHRIVELSDRLSVEMEAKKAHQSKIHTLNNSLIKKQDIEASYVELQGAHAAQQNLVMNLQAKITKYKKYLDTCNKQDTVISQLEALVTRDVNDNTQREALDILGKENSELRAMLRKHHAHSIHGASIDTERYKTFESFRDELSKTKRMCHELERKVEKHERMEFTVVGDKRDRVASLETKLEVAAARDRIIMDELKTSAVKWAKEKARYELERGMRHNTYDYSEHPAAMIAQARDSYAHHPDQKHITTSQRVSQQLSSPPSPSISTPLPTPQRDTRAPWRQSYPSHLRSNQTKDSSVSHISPAARSTEQSSVPYPSHVPSPHTSRSTGQSLAPERPSASHSSSAQQNPMSEDSSVSRPPHASSRRSRSTGQSLAPEHPLVSHSSSAQQNPMSEDSLVSRLPHAQSHRSTGQPHPSRTDSSSTPMSHPSHTSSTHRSTGLPHTPEPTEHFPVSRPPPAPPSRTRNHRSTRPHESAEHSSVSRPSHDSKSTVSRPSHDSKSTASRPSHDSKSTVSRPSHDSKSTASRPSHDSKSTVSHPSHGSKSTVSRPSHGSKSTEHFSVSRQSHGQSSTEHHSVSSQVTTGHRSSQTHVSSGNHSHSQSPSQSRHNSDYYL